MILRPKFAYRTLIKKLTILRIDARISLSAIECTVEGELSVANFIDNFFKGLRGKPVWLVWLVHRGTNLKKKGRNWRTSHFFFLLQYFFPPARVSVSSTIMAPPLDAATHMLIGTLLKQGFENKLIASEAACSVRAVQRIRLKRQ